MSGVFCQIITPAKHAGRYVVAWDPHVEYGTLTVTSTADITEAREFDSAMHILSEWKTISKVQPLRPDGKPNRPLSAMTITFADPKK